ncbi:MAG: V-type ATP synthase subunit I [Methanobrevibacter sp.]|jgi:V/A-type H+-transporting ATPase subunit I|nr:V-type ATP synthase subunit I [Methanobrevibacter sp.]
MFQTARMRKIKILTMNEYSKPTVNALHEAGIVQISDISERIQQDPQWAELLTPSKVTPLTGKISSLLMKTTGLSELLGEAISGEVGIKDMIKSFVSPEIPKKTEIPELTGEELVEKAESILNEVESQTKVIEDELNALDSRKSELLSNQSLATILKDLDLDLGLLGDSNYTFTLVGRIGVESVEKFKGEATKITDNLLVLETPDEDKLKVIIVVVSLNEFKEDFNSLLRSYEFEKLEAENLSGKPNEIISKSNSELESIEREKSQLKDKLKAVGEKWDDEVTILKEQLEIEKERNEIFATFGETEKAIMLEAWVPLKDLDKAKSIVEATSEGHSVIEVEEIPNDQEDVPVLQENPKLVKPYEFLVNLYSPVKYGELDPTIFVFVMFPFFFGYCLTDAFYGIMIVAIGIVLLKGIGKINETMKSFGSILVACGIWTIILGLLTGGFLGDFFPRFFLNGAQIPTVFTPYLDAFKHPEIILIIAIVIGLIYLNVGFIMGIINNFRYGQKKEALGSQIVWLVLEAGILFLVGGMMLGLGLVGTIIGAILIVATFAILIYCNGIYGIMDVFGFLGNVLSFARLLALCLATAGIAMTVNIIAEMLNSMIPVPFLGLIVAIFILIAGHIVNFLFQVLGAFINALRLHYVELFAQFFMGGDSKFNPFSAKRNITKIKR